MAIRSRGRSDHVGRDRYFVLIGVVVGALVTGLVMPFVWGGSTTTDAAGAGGSNSTSVGVAEVSPQAEPVAGAGGQAAGGTTNTSGGGGGRPAGAKGSGPGQAAVASGTVATDRGVTADTIKVGVPILDLGNAGKLGVQVPGLSPEEQRVSWRVYWDDLNRRGGILGRKITYVFHTFDILSADSMRAACLALTQDEKVFAVVDGGGYYGPAELCVTVENGTVMFTNGTVGTPKGYYTKSNGLLLSVLQSGPRLMRNFAWELGRLGRLKGHKIGLLYGGTTDDGETMDEFSTAIRDLGGEVAYRAELSMDQSTAASQVPLAVQQMRSAGVDSVMLISNLIYATQFVQNASSQAYYPKYYTTDYSAGSSDTYVAAMPDAFAGALSISSTRGYEVRVGVPEPALDASCRETWEKQTATKAPARGSNGYSGLVQFCNMVRLFEASARAAGPNLTRRGFSKGMQGLGHVPLADFGDGNFAPGKLDAVDSMGTLQYYSDCKCWKPIEFQHKVHDTSNSD